MERIQQLLDELVTDGLPGVTAEVRTPVSTTFATAGVRDLTTGAPREHGEHFRIGSVTKAFTAIVTLLLAGDGRLDLDDPVSRWVPALVDEAITVRHLLAQRSGLFNYSMDPELLAAETGPAFLEHRFDRFTPEELVKVALEHRPGFTPGTRWDYSNTNYILAGLVVERVTGQPFAEVLRRLVTERLGLTGTYLPGDDTSVRTPYAHSYTKALLDEPNSPLYDATELHPSKAWTAGGMISTVGDLNDFFGAVFAGDLLPVEQQRALLTTSSTQGAQWLPDTEYGLGIFSQTLPDGTVVWGGCGAITGTWTFSMGTPDGQHWLTANLSGDYGQLLQAFIRLASAEFGSARTS